MRTEQLPFFFAIIFPETTAHTACTFTGNDAETVTPATDWYPATPAAHALVICFPALTAHAFLAMTNGYAQAVALSEPLGLTASTGHGVTVDAPTVDT